jgi:hypothetical protein
VSLPPPGTPARESLHHEALRLGAAALRERPGQVACALYLVYDAFRLRFLEQRGLMDSVPGRDADSADALADARRLEQYVAARWSETVLTSSAIPVAKPIASAYVLAACQVAATTRL